MKRNLSTILLFLAFFIGLSLLLYPSVSHYWNSFHQSQTIATYAETVATIAEEDYEAYWEEAHAFNRNIQDRLNIFTMTEEEEHAYYQALNVSDNGIMGYIEIPSIKCSLPIYHGVDPAILQIAIGHIEWTSLPVGGEGTHSVLSGHRGLPSAKLFSDLDRMTVGDIFMMRILDETLTYQVDQLLIVEPWDVDALHTVPGEDLCTLVTCTPYGINSHRLLVRGHRIENTEEASLVYVTSDAMQIEPVLVAPLVAAPMLLILMLWILIRPKRRR